MEREMERIRVVAMYVENCLSQLFPTLAFYIVLIVRQDILIIVVRR